MLLGFVIAAAAALLFFFFFQTPAAPPTPIPATSTPVPLKKVVAARIDIAANTVLTDTETYLTLIDIPETEYRPESYFVDFSELTSKVTLRQIGADEIIRAEALVDAGLSLQVPPPENPDTPRDKVVPLEVGNLNGVADQIRPGDFVDLVMTYEVQRLVLRPSLTIDPVTNLPVVTTIEEPLIARTTKTMVQNVQVLRVLKPAIPDTAGTPTPEGGAPAAPVPAATASSDTFVPGAQWILLLAMSNQEAEIVKFTLDQQDPKPQITLVLRGRGDSQLDDTTGVTLQLLISRYGLPLPEPLQALPVSPDELTPGPARPSPTALPSP